ncbi:MULTISPECIES: acyltransferase family protein [Cupriavidus]
MDDTDKSRPYDVLDLIRALAAGLVCLGHVRALLIVDYGAAAHHGGVAGIALQAFYALCSVGHECVIVFFLLSGYLVGGTVRRKMARGGWRWRGYLADRMTRLWIVLLPALLLGLLWDSAGIHLAWGPYYQGTEGNAAQQLDVAQNLGMATLACNAAFLQTIACQTYGSNGPLWSLACEFWYYLWFPALYGALRLRRTPQVWLCLAGALVTMALFRGLLEGYLYWLLGVLAQVLEAKLRGRRAAPLPAWLVPPAVLAFLAAVALARHRPYADAAVAAGFFVLLLAVLSCRARIRHAGLSRLATSASGFSYSLYLTHFPLVLFIAAVVVKQRAPVGAASLGAMALVLLACYAYAYAAYWMCERNTRRVRDLLGHAALPAPERGQNV